MDPTLPRLPSPVCVLVNFSLHFGSPRRVCPELAEVMMEGRACRSKSLALRVSPYDSERRIAPIGAFHQGFVVGNGLYLPRAGALSDGRGTRAGRSTRRGAVEPS